MILDHVRTVTLGDAPKSLPDCEPVSPVLSTLLGAALGLAAGLTVGSIRKTKSPVPTILATLGGGVAGYTYAGFKNFGAKLGCAFGGAAASAASMGVTPNGWEPVEGTPPAQTSMGSAYKNEEAVTGATAQGPFWIMVRASLGWSASADAGIEFWQGPYDDRATALAMGNKIGSGPVDRSNFASIYRTKASLVDAHGYPLNDTNDAPIHEGVQFHCNVEAYVTTDSGCIFHYAKGGGECGKTADFSTSDLSCP